MRSDKTCNQNEFFNFGSNETMQNILALYNLFFQILKTKFKFFLKSSIKSSNHLYNRYENYLWKLYSLNF